MPGVFYVLSERSFPEAALRLIDDLGLGAVDVTTTKSISRGGQ